ncbi:MAG TPA: winged helix-turn-helix domain-containing protein [Terracidiphilus sp.]|jgi:DNA-binding winged helix-turn-helix (wHTH) protein/tetratricopeptide (TPR) repeat protein
MVQSRSASGFPDSPGRSFKFSDLRLEADGTLIRGDQIIHLPPKELAALKLLLAHPGQIVTHQQLKKALWGDVHVTDDSVPKCMSSLRELLVPDDCIQTVYKRGYRLSVDVENRQYDSPEARPRLAILPFTADVNVPIYLGHGIAEEIIALITADRLAPVHVLARDSAFSLAARGLTAHQVGEALSADLVLTGTLRSLPSQFRLRAEMIRVADGIQIWVEDMLVPQTRAAALESELANRLVVRLSTHDWFRPQPIAAREGEDSSVRREAYELFLRGHHEWQSLQRHRMQDGVQRLALAVELDPSLYVAHIDLANASVTQAFSGFISPLQAAEQVRRAADALPPSVEGAEAILPPLGWIRFHVDHDLPGALRAFATSMHLPHETSVTRLRSMLALSRHQFLDAIALISDALQLDPYSPWLNARLAWAYHLSGEKEKSLAQAEHALELFPDHDSSNVYGTIILAFNGKAERAIGIAENLVRRSPHLDLGTAVYAYALVQAGRHDDVRSILERLQWLSRERFVLSSFTPAVHVAVGDLESAITDLQGAAEVRCPWFFQMLADPRIEPLRSLPEFVKMLKVLERMENAAARKADHEG